MRAGGSCVGLLIVSALCSIAAWWTIVNATGDNRLFWLAVLGVIWLANVMSYSCGVCMGWTGRE